jgi:hypothetical protein
VDREPAWKQSWQKVEFTGAGAVEPLAVKNTAAPSSRRVDRVPLAPGRRRI